MPTQGTLLNRDVPFVDAVLRAIEDEAALDRAATLLYHAEVRHGIAFMDAPEIRVTDPWLIDDVRSHLTEGAWSARVLQPFLAETHMLLTGQDCQRLVLYDVEGCDRTYSWRAWGAEMAEWANVHVGRVEGWLENRTSWTYIDFYMDGYLERADPSPHKYSRWVEALFRVVQRKAEIYDWTFSPPVPYDARGLQKDFWWRGKIEVAQGQAHPCVPPPDGEAKFAAARLGEHIRDHVQQHQLGRFYPEGTRFVVAEDPYTVLEPCWGLITRPPKPPKSRVGWIPRRPDLVFEAQSKSDINRRLDMKVARWLGAGVPEVWVLDAGMHQLTMHAQDGSPRIVTGSERLSGGDILPGFELPMEALFL